MGQLITTFCGYTVGEIKGMEKRIAELEKERDEANCHAYYILETCMVFSPANFEAHNLEQQRKGFWLGFEDARCHPDEMNILNQWENTKVFIESKGGAL